MASTVEEWPTLATELKAVADEMTEAIATIKNTTGNVAAVSDNNDILTTKILDPLKTYQTNSQRDLGNHLAIIGAAEVFTSNIQWMRGMDHGGFSEPVWSYLYRLYSCCLSYTDSSEHFTKELGKAGVIPILIQNLQEFKESWTTESKYEAIVNRSLGIMCNMSMFSSMRPVFRETNAMESLMPYLKVNNEKFKTDAILTLAYVIDEKNLRIAMDLSVVGFITGAFTKAVEDEKKRYRVGDASYSASELAMGIERLAINDTPDDGNKLKLVENAVLPPLFKLMTKGDEEEQLRAIKAIIQLAFLPTNREKILQLEFIPQLQKLEQSGNRDVANAALGALWELQEPWRQSDEIPHAGKPDETKEDRRVGHVMLSYQWDNQEVVKQIKTTLEAKGHNVWMDIDKMSGSTLDAMAKAVEDAAVVLICMSCKYKESANCRRECTYAVTRKKDIIPLKMEGKYKPDGWLGIVAGDSLYFNFDGKDSFDDVMTRLITELGNRGKLDELDSKPQGAPSEENDRLKEDKLREKDWKRWGPYLSERQWATVREDYSEDGSCWDYFPHEQSRSRAYRWGEDGILGITDRKERLCFALGLWNEKDPILKERLFGLTGNEGNHGEDCKECYYYLDSTPTHSYMRALYKYPQSEYPYAKLVEENGKRGLHDMEYELVDTGVFDENRYWDIYAEYAKQSPEDILCKTTVANRGPEEATLHLLPTLWYRNTWSWGCETEDCTMKPEIKKTGEDGVECTHETPKGKERFTWAVDKASDGTLPTLLFTENETNNVKLFGGKNSSPYVKDAFHRYIIKAEKDAVNPNGVGTKVAAQYVLKVKPGEQATVCCRLYRDNEKPATPLFGDAGFETVMQQRKQEADAFYKEICDKLDDQQYLVAKQGYAGLLWSKQFYHYVIREWLDGDPDQPVPPQSRKNIGRNHGWKHLYNRDIISMPDKWEYPWYASWDLAFHMVAFVKIDPEFAKNQLLLFLREWYMHPNGQIPAYEFAFSDVNPPVHAWAVRRVYEITGKQDTQFLERCFQKLILNFTWWVNRKDPDGKNLFAGGFLGLDNIGVIDRSKPLPYGSQLYQADGTAWMAFFCAEMLGMALELALTAFPNGFKASEDMASKFFEHFMAIAEAMNHAHSEVALWDEEDGFYYDQLTIDGVTTPLRIRSMVGLVPLFTCQVLDSSRLENLTDFIHRLNWFIKNRADVAESISFMKIPETDAISVEKLLAIPKTEQLESVLKYMLDENEFLSPYGIRSLSKVHLEQPFVLKMDDGDHCVQYTPGESDTYLFGGNSNWRGPVWLPVNYLIIESLERYDDFYGENLKVECPTGSGNFMRLKSVAKELARRLSRLFIPDETGKRPCHGDSKRYRTDPHWKDLVLFYEYFHGDTGRGCGASHQTGWTALVVNCLDRLAD